MATMTLHESLTLLGMGSLTKKKVSVFTVVCPHPKSRLAQPRQYLIHRIFRSLQYALKSVGMDKAAVKEPTTEKLECALPRLSHNVQIMYQSARGT